MSFSSFFSFLQYCCTVLKSLLHLKKVWLFFIFLCFSFKLILQIVVESPSESDRVEMLLHASKHHNFAAGVDYHWLAKHTAVSL